MGARHSAFTGELIDLLTDGSIEFGTLLRLADVYSHLRKRLKSRSLPEPQQCGVDTTPNLALTRNPAWPAGRQGGRG